MSMRVQHLPWPVAIGAQYTYLGVNFINVLRARFSSKFLVLKSLEAKTKLYNFWRQNFVQKMPAENVNEIDGWGKKMWNSSSNRFLKA